MIAPEDPPGFVVRTEAQKAAWDKGYRLNHGMEGGWLRYASTTAPGNIWIASASQRGPWLLSIDHSGVSAELESAAASSFRGPGIITLVFDSLPQLHATLDRAY